MAMTLGTRGEDGKSLIRDTDQFKKNLALVSFAGRKTKMVSRVRGGKRTYSYGSDK